MSISQIQDPEQPTYFFLSDDQVLRDWLDSDTIVNSIADLSPVNTLCDLPDIIPEEEDIVHNYFPMPRNFPRALTPPLEYEESSSGRRSILFESSISPYPGASSYSQSRSEYLRPSMNRARQSVSSIASCSTAHTKSTPAPVKSILTRHDSGVSLATTTKTSRKKKRSPLSVKFVEAPPLVHYDHSHLSVISTSPCSPSSTSSGQKKIKPSRWFTRWWKKPSSTPPRPIISGPYSLARTASLVDVHGSRSRPIKCGRLKRFWIRVTTAVR